MKALDKVLRQCGTCDLWGGPRGISANKGYVELANEKQEGFCLRIKPHNIMSQQQFCSHFKKWSHLR